MNETDPAPAFIDQATVSICGAFESIQGALFVIALAQEHYDENDMHEESLRPLFSTLATSLHRSAALLERALEAIDSHNTPH